MLVLSCLEAWMNLGLEIAHFMSLARWTFSFSATSASPPAPSCQSRPRTPFCNLSNAAITRSAHSLSLGFNVADRRAHPQDRSCAAAAPWPPATKRSGSHSARGPKGLGQLEGLISCGASKKIAASTRPSRNPRFRRQNLRRQRLKPPRSAVHGKHGAFTKKRIDSHDLS